MEPLPPAGQALTARELFTEHVAFVARFFKRLGVGPDLRDDLVQDVFEVVHRRGGYRPGPARPTTWLAAIAINVVKRERRGLRHRLVSFDEEAIESAQAPHATPVEAIEAEEERHLAVERVQRALNALPLELRSILILHEFEEEKCSAIAAALGIPTGTVCSRLATARREFQKIYERQIKCCHQVRPPPRDEVEEVYDTQPGISGVRRRLRNEAKQPSPREPVEKTHDAQPQSNPWFSGI